MAAACLANPALAGLTNLEMKLDDQKIPVVEVQGPHRDAYREVLTKTLKFAIWARGHDYNHADAPSALDLDVRGMDQTIHAGLFPVWTRYDISMNYTIPRSSYAPMGPIWECNHLLESVSGAAREDFLFNGATITRTKAYYVRGKIPSINQEAVVEPSVLIKCLPLDHDPQRAKLRIEPAKMETVGKFICPMELKLHGAVESREKFTGKAIFVGPHYLSGITDLNYTKAGNRNANATYKINWSQMGGFTTAPNQGPKKQDLTFRFNISDKNGKVVETAEERVQVSCKKIKVAVPTVGDEMTVKPAN
jgi:hypothetical protein